MKRRCPSLSADERASATTTHITRRRSPPIKRSHASVLQTVVCTSVADGRTREQWVSGQHVIAPGVGAREFTFITRHQMLDGTTIPTMTPAEVHTALERLDLAPLIPTVVTSPATSAPAVSLEVADLGEKGCGVLTNRDVAAGEAVCDYVGEILSKQEAAARQSVYDDGLRHPGFPRPASEGPTLEGCAEACDVYRVDTAAVSAAGSSTRRGMNYLLVLLEHLPTRTVRTSVDPTHFGGVAACINHSCAPNLIPTVVRDGSIVPTVRLVASVQITEGAEITFDYGDLYDDTEEARCVAAGPTSKRTPCLCGTEKCRGYLPFVP